MSTKKAKKDNGELKIKRNRISAPLGEIETKEMMAKVEGLGEVPTKVFVVTFDSTEYPVGSKKDARAKLRELRSEWRKENVTEHYRERQIISVLSGLAKREAAFSKKFGKEFPELAAAYADLKEKMVENLQ